MPENRVEGKYRCKHPLISRFNSWLLAVYEKPFHEETGSMKTERMKDLEGTVVELGPGNGINFRYYPKGVKVIAVEPNPYMHERLGEHAKIYQTEVEVNACYLEDLQLEDGSIDAVVCSLVLCTVPDQEGTLEEILRILKPGGRFVFLEHVAAADGSVKRKLQNLLVRPWKWLFDGCVTNRDTGSLLNRVGFSHVEMEAFDSKAMPPPISPSIVGVATK
jgi:ubiquinone/menaquinone biosynthesis C-methylase UbiE